MSREDDVLGTSLQFLKGVGPRRAADLRKAGLSTVEDLLYRFPIRYEDRGHLQSIAELKPGHPASLAGDVLSCGLRATRRPGFRIFEALIRDGTGSIRATWLNQPFLRDVLRPHQRLVLFGQVELKGYGGPQLLNPQFEIIEQEDGPTIHTGRIVPVYEKAGILTPKMQRRLVYDALQRVSDELTDPLPADVLTRHGLPARASALREAHFPSAGASLAELNRFRTAAQRRLIFEEFFLFQVGLALKRRDADRERKTTTVRVDDRIRAAARAVLPFKLTTGQREALKQIVDDMQRPRPMNRLLQADVGAGKTIVALLAALVAMENGLQVAFMAPTEILADQHCRNISRLLEKSRFTVGCLTGASQSLERRQVVEGLRSGAVNLAVGTHALVQKSIAFKRLGLVVIDEQHRFGVVQRATLREKGEKPDVLVMTATPIPRTLALTAYGDLDVSVMRDMPPGRLPVKTIVKPESRRDEIHAFVKTQLDQGRQAYVIYPLVEESDKLELKAATEMADHLAQEVFQAYRVALIHGRMNQDAKDRVMQAFSSGTLDVLVSTTVVEVGVDVPNATVMVVEHAERFGLSQLHQLRGRVGRGGDQAYCLLLYQSPLSDQARLRLQALSETNDGFVIAERDLDQRGPGDFFGTRQSGMPTLRIGDLLRDREILEDAHAEANTIVDQAVPDLPLIQLVRSTWEQRFGLIGVG